MQEPCVPVGPIICDELVTTPTPARRVISNAGETSLLVTIRRLPITPSDGEHQPCRAQQLNESR